MIPSLQSLAALAIIKDPKTSRALWELLEPEKGQFGHMKVLFAVKDGNVRSFLRSFENMQASGNRQVYQRAVNIITATTPTVPNLKDVNVDLDRIESFCMHLKNASIVNPIEAFIVQKFLKDFHITVTTHQDYLDLGQEQNRVLQLNELPECKVIKKLHVMTLHGNLLDEQSIEYKQVEFDEDTTPQEKDLFMRLFY